jgi:hypothetical protein
MITQNQLVTIQNTAFELGMSEATVRRLAARKVLEAVRISARRIGIRRSSIESLKTEGYRSRNAEAV